ncbi:MAG: hypothetical protein O2857_26470 [Planctomycetota bacterium]|nr:hypothetical protein [Planctomycetota bacterium]
MSIASFTSIPSDQPAAIPPELLIVSHDGTSVGNALSAQHPVEWFFVMEGQIFQQEGIFTTEVQLLEAALSDHFDWVKVDIQLADGGFDHQFGNGDGTHVDDVGEIFQFCSPVF